MYLPISIPLFILDANAAASNTWHGKNMKMKEVDKRVTEKLKENIEMLLNSSEMEVDSQSNVEAQTKVDTQTKTDNQTKDDTQSQTNIQNTVDPQNNVDTQSNVDTQTKIDTQTNVNEPNNDDCVRLEFEVVLCPDFNFKEGEDMLLIAAGYPWSNFEEPVVIMKFIKRIEDGYIHFKVLFSLDS